MSTRGKRRELQAKRAEEGVGSRGPMPGLGGRPEEEEESVRHRGVSCRPRGPRREWAAVESVGHNNTMFSRGSMPGSGGCPGEAESEWTQRREHAGREGQGGSGQPWAQA